MSNFVSFGGGKYRQMNLDYGEHIVTFSNETNEDISKRTQGMKACGCKGDLCHHDSWKKKQDQIDNTDLSSMCQWCGKTRGAHMGEHHAFSPYSSGNIAKNTKVLNQ